jgi:flagellar hook-associated protein 1 FlgK
MSLSVAFNTARSSLMNTTGQIAVSGMNVAGASDPSYSRKLSLTTTTSDGSARLLSVTRATDLAVYDRMLGATSSAAHQDALLSGIERLQLTIGDAETGWSPAALLGELDSALQQYASSPDNDAYAQNVVTQAGALAKGLNDATTEVQAVRAQADADMAASVAKINELLETFQTLNTAVVKGSALGGDVTDEMDARDSIVAQLSEELGVDVVRRAGNDMALYTEGGVTLFDKTARTVSFEPTLAYGAATTGKSVRVDGVPVVGPEVTTQGLRSGRLLGFAELRDDVAVTYQAQLDEIARGLIATFAEVDQSGVDVDRVGLFAWSSAAPPADLAAGETVVPGTTAGLAGQIKVNRAVDPAQGGELTRIRDGGVNGTDYVYNADGMASYAQRLADMTSALAAPRTDFSPTTELSSTQSLAGFASSSIGWLEGLRAKVSAEVDYQSTLLATASTALSNATGVNVDDEYARQLQLEQAYHASAKLIGIVDELFQTLFAAVG